MDDGYIFGPPPPPPPKFSPTPQRQQHQQTSQRTHHPVQHNNRINGQRHAVYVPYEQRGSNQQRRGQRYQSQLHNSVSDHFGSNTVGSGHYAPPITMNNAYGQMPQMDSHSYAGMVYATPLNQTGSYRQPYVQPLVTPAPSLVPRNTYNPSLVSTSLKYGPHFASDTGYPFPQPLSSAQQNWFNSYADHTVAEVNEDVDEEAALGSRPTTSMSAAIITIPGTTISLQTEEDIAKWISERKKKWPTERRIQEKEQELQRKTVEEDEVRKAKEKLREEKKKEEDNIFAKHNICKFFAKTGRCNRGSKCSFSHQRMANTSSTALTTKKYKRYNKPQKMPLFKRLVQNDWDKENEKVLDFISFLVDIGVVNKSKAA
ncbi:uncharacterized protein V1513DRAFT_130680 [Lipomyces chichibuensis]|uniref:uncharacterized protein n=1 Tax=Lipomyces chichibuensis TaxID=1546026 RepID=UPI003343C0A1